MTRSIVDNRSKQFVFVPFCALAQAYHAQGLAKYDWGGAITPLLQVLLEHDVNIVQMPCLETEFHGGPKTGLGRVPQGRKHYDVPEFRSLCREKARQVAEQIEGILANGYEVSAIVGMEYSPSCAVRLQYPPRKDVPKEGVFIQELQSELEERGHQIPFLGINRRAIGPTLERLRQILNVCPAQAAPTAVVQKRSQ